MNLKKSTKALFKKHRASLALRAIAIGTLSLAGFTSYAQQGFDFGLRGNIQTTSLINSTDQAAGPELDFKNYTTAAFGISAGYSFNNHMGVELNILSSKQGQGYTGNTNNINANSEAILSSYFSDMATAQGIAFSGPYTARITTSCLKIPVLFRYTGNTTKKVYFTSFIGPQINMLSSVKYTVNDVDVNFSGSSVKAEDLYKKTTIDLAFGLGAAYNITKNISVSLQLRVDYGFSDLEKKDFTYSGAEFWDHDRAGTHNATGGALIGLNYKLLKKAAEPAKGKPAPAKKK